MMSQSDIAPRQLERPVAMGNIDSYRPTNRTAYENTQMTQALATEQKMADDMYRQSRDPWNTHVAPNSFNRTPGALVPPQPSNTIQPQTMSIGDPAPTDMFSGLATSSLPDTFIQNNLFQHNIMHPGIVGPTTPAVVPPYHNGPSQIQRPEADRNPNQRTMTDTKIEPFHNNMVPFYGAKLTQNMDIDQNRSTLELFTGAPGLKPSKHETANFFEPQKNPNVNGACDFDQHLDRYKVSGIQQGIRPFQPIKVGVGINEGPTSRPTGGFHDMYRPPIRTVDELRVGSQPKVTYAGRVLPPKAVTEQRGKVGETFKNLPETAFAQTHDNLFKTTGAYTKAQAPSNFYVKPTNRKNPKPYKGIAGPAGDEKETSRPGVQKDRRQTIKSTGVRNAVLPDGWTVKKKSKAADISGYGKDSITNYDNERTFTGCRTTVTNIKPAIERESAKPEDKFKQTRKQQYVTYTRPGNVEKSVTNLPVYISQPLKTTIKETNIHDASTGNMGRQAPTRNALHVPDDRARTTVKETTITDSSTGNMGRQAPSRNALHVPGDRTRTTVKETTIHDSSTGNMGRQAPTRTAMHVPGDRTRTTVRETGIHNASTGHMGRQGPSNQKMHIPDDRTRTTIKETLIHDTRTGNINLDVKNSSTENFDKDDWKMRTTLREAFPDGPCGSRKPVLTGASRTSARNLDKARTTIKETLQDNTREGNIVTEVVEATQRPGDPVRTTIKETTIDSDRTGNVDTLQQSSGYQTAEMEAKEISRQYLADTEHFSDPARSSGQGYLTNPQESKDTMRQYVSDVEYIGPAGDRNVAPMSQDDMKYVTLNTGKEEIARGRAPTQVSTKLTAGQEQYGDVESNRMLPTQDDRDLATQKTYQIVASPDPCEITKESNQTAELPNNRMDTNLLDSFRQNPFTQSLNSY